MPLGHPKHPLLTRSLKFLRAAAPSTGSTLCLYRSHPFVAAEERNRSHAEKQKVWSRSCGLQEVWQCTDCASMWLLQTKLLAAVVWKRGCQPFSCPCAENVTHCRNEICSTCLSKSKPKESIPAIPLGERSIHFLPETWHLRAEARSPALLYACIMPIPSLHLQKKTCLMQRSRGCSHRLVVSKICYNAVIVLSVVLCDCRKLMTKCRDWAFSNSGLEMGLAACVWKAENLTHSRKQIYATCLSNETIPAIPFWNTKHPLPTRSFRFLRAAAAASSSTLYLHFARRLVSAAEKRPISFREAEGLVTELWSPRIVTITITI